MTEKDKWIVWPSHGEPSLMYDARLYVASFVVADSYYSFDLTLQEVKEMRSWCDDVIEHWETQ